VPAQVWRNLPGTQRRLCAAAARYYQTRPEYLVPVPGSQYAIGQAPQWFAPAAVALPAIGFAEHAKAWQQAGHRAVFYDSIAQLQHLAEQGGLQHAVIINPNNPTAEVCTLPCLELLHSTLPGVVLVDEAFLDASALPSAAVLLARCPRLCVLRSVGKFFGLAGIRLGFFLNAGEFAVPMRQALGPWAVSHPAQWIGERALADHAWQRAQLRRLGNAQRQLYTVLQESVGDSVTLAQGGLFITLRGSWAKLMALYQALAERGIYTRWCHWQKPQEQTPRGVPAPMPWLRIGLPDDGGARIAAALKIIDRIK
jgi:cobalamin biosynthetic protein CobC